MGIGGVFLRYLGDDYYRSYGRFRQLRSAGHSRRCVVCSPVVVECCHLGVQALRYSARSATVIGGAAACRGQHGRGGGGYRLECGRGAAQPVPHEPHPQLQWGAPHDAAACCLLPAACCVLPAACCLLCAAATGAEAQCHSPNPVCVKLRPEQYGAQASMHHSGFMHAHTDINIRAHVCRARGHVHR